MTRLWIDPRAIDWEDGLNPLRVRSFRRRRYFAAALSQPLTMALRTAPGYSMFAEALPASGGILIPGLATYDDVLRRLPAESWIIALAASSAQPEGFTAQMTTGERPSWSAPVHSSSLSAGAQYFLPQPLGITAPDQLTVRLVNQSAVANDVQLVFWIVAKEAQESAAA
jgi:hypothetical protein